MKGTKLDAWWITSLILLILTILTFLFAPLFYSLFLFLAVYLPIILFILIYKWIEKWFAAFIFSFSVWLNLVLLLIPVLGGFLALDVVNFYSDLQKKPNFIAIEDNDIIFAARLDLIQEAIKDKNAEEFILNKQETKNLQNEIKSKKVKDKTIFVIEEDVFNITNTIEIEELKISISKDKAIDALKSDDPLEVLLSELPEETRIILELLDIEEIKKNKEFSPKNIKSIVAVLLFQEIIKKGGSEYLIEELKNGNIKIYPERTSINLIIKFIPSDIISNSGLVPNTITTSESVASKVVKNN